MNNARHYIPIIIAVALATLVGLNVAAYNALGRGESSYTSAPRFNEIMSERLLRVASRGLDSAVIGASDASQIPPPGCWPEKHFTLALQGDSPATGLSLLASTGEVPKRLFISLEFASRAHKRAFVESRQRWWAWQRWFPVFYTELRPLNYMFYKKFDRQYEKENPNIIAAAKRKNWAEREKDLLPHVENYLAHVRPMDMGKAHAMLTEVRAMADDFAARGATVIFYRLPLHPLLQQLERRKRLMKLENSIFAGYPIVEFAPENYATEDGIHPTAPDGNRMFIKLMEEAAKLEKKAGKTQLEFTLVCKTAY